MICCTASCTAWSAPTAYDGLDTKSAAMEKRTTARREARDLGRARVTWIKYRSWLRRARIFRGVLELTRLAPRTFEARRQRAEGTSVREGLFGPSRDSTGFAWQVLA